MARREEVEKVERAELPRLFAWDTKPSGLESMLRAAERLLTASMIV